jgi:hypothetical protein
LHVIAPPIPAFAVNAYALAVKDAVTVTAPAGIVTRALEPDIEHAEEGAHERPDREYPFVGAAATATCEPEA